MSSRAVWVDWSLLMSLCLWLRKQVLCPSLLKSTPACVALQSVAVATQLKPSLPSCPLEGTEKKKQARVAMKAICCNITDRLHQLWKSFRKKRRKKVPIVFVFLAQRLLLILQLDEMFFKNKSSWNLIYTWNIKTKQPEWIEHKELASLKWHSFGQ